MYIRDYLHLICNFEAKHCLKNSIIKSKHFSKKTKLICLADDSGLEIDLLNKAPGIYSARWGGKNGDFGTKKCKFPPPLVARVIFSVFQLPASKMKLDGMRKIKF